jgi:glycine oxidase
MRGNLCVATTPEQATLLETRVRGHRARGLSARLLSAGEASALVPGLEARCGALFPEDGVVDNQELMPALRDALLAAGVALHEDDPVGAVLTEAGRAVGVRTTRGTHPAGAVVLAAGAWLDGLLPPGEPRTAMHPARGQIVVLEAGATGPDLPVIGEHMYVVPRAGGRMLLGSTVENAGFDRGTTAGGVAGILSGVAAFYPGVAAWGWVTAWAGLRPRASDDWPVVGPARETGGLYIAGGHYRNGILWAPLTAEWILRGLQGESLPEEAGWFDPGRFGQPGGGKSPPQPGYFRSTTDEATV